MIKKIIKTGFYLIIFLLFLAILPEEVFNKAKQIFNLNVFLNTLRVGWDKFINFLETTTGIDFNKVPLKLKETFGFDIISFWATIKKFLANIFSKLANFFR